MVKNTVLIRGLDRDLYNRIVGKAKEQGKNIAELMNEAMTLYLREVAGEKQESSDLQRIIIGGSVMLSKADVLGIYGEIGRFHLVNSGELTLDNDFDKETFHHIEKIDNTGKLKVPKHVHHLALLKAGHISGEVEKY
jgi:hypothetical protein